MSFAALAKRWDEGERCVGDLSPTVVDGCHVLKRRLHIRELVSAMEVDTAGGLGDTLTVRPLSRNHTPRRRPRCRR